VEILRFPDLKALGIVNNRMTLRRWIEGHGFPKHVQLGPNSIGWIRAEVQAWLAIRAAERKLQASALKPDHRVRTDGFAGPEKESTKLEKEADGGVEPVMIGAESDQMVSTPYRSISWRGDSAARSGQARQARALQDRRLLPDDDRERPDATRGRRCRKRHLRDG
jgi:prophage regulatory protein